MLNTKPETLQEMDDTELATRKSDTQRLDRWARAQFSLKGILGWALGAAAIAGTLAVFGLPLVAVVAPVAAAVTAIPPFAGFLSTFYTGAELKRIDDLKAERARPRRKIEVIFEDGTKSIIAASPASTLGSSFANKASPSTGIDALPMLPAPADKPMPLLLPAPPKTSVA